jgi:hypothetical protein
MGSTKKSPASKTWEKVKYDVPSMPKLL